MRLAAVLIALPLAAGCATAAGPLARVNGEEVTGKDLKREFARHHMALDRIIGDEKEVRGYVEKVVDRRLLLQEGRRMGLNARADVRAALESWRGEKLRQLLLKEEVDDRAKVTDDEVKAVYDGFKEALEVHQLVVATEADAVALRARLAAGEDFEKLARERSIAPSAVQGGLAAIVWGFDPAREKVGYGLQPKELSAPFRSDLGWEILRLEQRVAPKEYPTLAKLTPRIRGALERRAKAERRAALVEEARRKHDARALDCPVRAEELRRVLAGKEPDAKALGERPCVTWTGGALTLRQVAARVMVEEIEKVPKEKLEEVGRQILEDLRDEQALIAEARARGLDRRPELVEEAAGKEDDLVEDVLLVEHVLAGLSATDEEVKGWYDAHPGDFVEPARLRVAQIVVESPEKAAELRRRLDANEPFEALAKAESKDTRSAQRGGFVGEFALGELEPQFSSLGTLKAGEVSAPIQTVRGYHLVKVLSITPERPLPFEEAKAAARRAVLQPRVEERRKKWLGTLRADARIEISDRAIHAYSVEKTAALRAENAADAAKRAKGKTRHGGEMHPGRGAPAGPAPAAPAAPAPQEAAPAAEPSPTGATAGEAPAPAR